MLPAYLLQENYEHALATIDKLHEQIAELNEQLASRSDRIDELEELLDDKQAQIESQTQDHLQLIKRQAELDAKIPRMMVALRTVRDLADEFYDYADGFNYIPCDIVTRYLSDMQKAVSGGLYATGN